MSKVTTTTDNNNFALPSANGFNILSLPNEVFFSIIDTLEVRSILDFTTAVGHLRDEGVRRALARTGGNVELRTAQQVISFTELILKAPEKRGGLVDTLSLHIPVFENPNDAERLRETIMHLTKLHSLYLERPEAGLAAHPRLISGFRSLRSIRMLAVTDADEWTNHLLSRLRSGLECLAIYRRAASGTSAHDNFSMSCVLWRFAHTLQWLHVDAGFATHLDDDFDTSDGDSADTDGESDLADSDGENDLADSETRSEVAEVDHEPEDGEYHADGESEADKMDVDSIFVPEVDESSGYSSGYTSDTYAEDEPRALVLDGAAIDKKLATCGALEDDEPTGSGSQRFALRPATWPSDESDSEEPTVEVQAHAYEHGRTSDERLADEDSAWDATSDLDEVEWQGQMAIFPALQLLSIPSLTRDTGSNLMFAAPFITSLDVGGKLTTYTRGARRLRRTNKAETYLRYEQLWRENTARDWPYLEQVRGGLVDLAVLGNTTIAQTLEIVGVITRHHALIPVVVGDNIAETLRMTLALPFRTARLQNPLYANAMNTIKSLALRVVMKRDIHMVAFETNLQKVLLKFGGLEQVFIDLTYYQNNRRPIAKGSLDGLDLDALARKLVETAAGKSCKLLALKFTSFVKFWKVSKIRKGLENEQEKWVTTELEDEEGWTKMEEVHMFSDTFHF